MKNLQTYSKEQFHNRILEKLKVFKDSNDPILDIIPDEWFDQGRYGRIFLHFSNISALLMYYLEMRGQISDGKYENSSPKDHWEWISRSFFIVDGNEDKNAVLNTIYQIISDCERITDKVIM